MRSNRSPTSRVAVKSPSRRFDARAQARRPAIRPGQVATESGVSFFSNNIVHFWCVFGPREVSVLQGSNILGPICLHRVGALLLVSVELEKHLFQHRWRIRTGGIRLHCNAIRNSTSSFVPSLSLSFLTRLKCESSSDTCNLSIQIFQLLLHCYFNWILQSTSLIA